MVDETDLYHFSYLPHPRMVSYIAFLAHSSGIVTMSVDGYCRIWSRVVAKPAAYFVASVLDCSKDLATYNEENQTNLSFDFISFSWAEPDSHANDFFDTTGMGDTVDAMLSLRTLTGEVFVWKLKVGSISPDFLALSQSLTTYVECIQHGRADTVRLLGRRPGQRGTGTVRHSFLHGYPSR
jgi:hypothetical protein